MNPDDEYVESKYGYDPTRNESSAFKGHQPYFAVFDEAQAAFEQFSKISFDFASAFDSTGMWNAAGNEEWFTVGEGNHVRHGEMNTKITTSEPRKGYINAGIDLSEGVSLTRKDFDEMSAEEWNDLGDLIDAWPNLEVNEILPGKLSYLYSDRAVITTLEA